VRTLGGVSIISGDNLVPVLVTPRPDDLCPQDADNFHACSSASSVPDPRVTHISTDVKTIVSFVNDLTHNNLTVAVSLVCGTMRDRSHSKGLS
jgi:hypothetical protein